MILRVGQLQSFGCGSFGTVLVSDILLGAGTSSFDCYSDESHDSTNKKRGRPGLSHCCF